MFNVVICTVNRTTQTDGIQREKAALNSHWENSVSFDFSFSVEERPDFIHAMQQTNEQSPTTTCILTL